MKANVVTEKTNLHPRNKHKFGYNFDELILFNFLDELKW